MFYKEFDAVLEGKAKRIGFLGENHIYTLKESDFAYGKVINYSCVGVERVEGFHLAHLCLDTLRQVINVPSDICYEIIKGRNPDLKTAEKHAKDLDKKLVRLDMPIPLYKYPMIIALGAASIPFLPLSIILGNNDEEIYFNEEYPENSAFRIKSYLGHLKQRDMHMARAAMNHLKSLDNMLINSGSAHIPGMIRIFRESADMRLIREEMC